MQQPQKIHYRFEYFHQTDMIQFSIKVGPSPVVNLGLNSESFFSLCEGIAEIAKPFFENVKVRRAEGIEQDIKVEFDSEAWNRMMEDSDDKGN